MVVINGPAAIAGSILSRVKMSGKRVPVVAAKIAVVKADKPILIDRI
jgi:hypothetical protein